MDVHTQSISSAVMNSVGKVVMEKRRSVPSGSATRNQSNLTRSPHLGDVLRPDHRQTFRHRIKEGLPTILKLSNRASD